MEQCETYETSDEAWRQRVSDDHVLYASLDTLREIVASHNAKAFVWPDEGVFVDGRWEFNAGHLGRFEPLLIDPTTALLLVKVHEALTEDGNKTKFARWIAHDRGSFATMLQFCWDRASSPDTHAGTA